jgi:hypothetical protein
MLNAFTVAQNSNPRFQLTYGMVHKLGRLGGWTMSSSRGGERSLSPMKNKLTTIIREARMAKCILAKSRDQIILYNVDFALIFGYLFEGIHSAGGDLPPDQEPDIARLGHNILKSFTESDEKPFKLLISIPTVYEFARHAVLTGQSLEAGERSVRSDVGIYDKIVAMAEERSLHTMLRDREIQNELDKAVQAVLRLVPQIQMSSDWSKMSRLLKDSSIQGFGDYYTRADYTSVATDIKRKVALLDPAINQIRRRKQNEAEESFVFRNRIDACNLAASDGLNSTHSSQYQNRFLGAFPASRTRGEVYQIIERSHAHSAEAAFILSVMREFPSTKAGSDDPVTLLSRRGKWLDNLHDDAATQLDRIVRCQSYEDIGRERLPELAAFFQRAEHAFFPSEAKVSVSASRRTEARVGGELLNGYEAFIRLMEQTREEIRSVTGEVFKIPAVVTSEELLADFELDTDPVVVQIREGLWGRPAYR